MLFGLAALSLVLSTASSESGRSLLHLTAHPDDEHGGTLTLLSRGQGVRVVLLSLTRGEAGANAIGPELFDGLGWIRAEELALAGRYYGIDALYFTRLADYGYSKRLSEAEEKWGREQALRDVVTIIRRERPQVIVSRFQGNERDGHGQHQFAGVIAREAFRASGDARLFPEAGAPFQPQKLYIGGVREDEDWNVVVDAGVYDPSLSDSYENVARVGLSLQRSQTAGRVRPVEGSFRRYYRRVESLVEASEKESSFFDGIGMASTVEGPPEGIRLTAIARPQGAAEDEPMGPVVPGDAFDLRLSFWNGSREPVRLVDGRLHLARGWHVLDVPVTHELAPNETWSRVVQVRLDEDAAVWKPHIRRASIAESRYEGDDWYQGAPSPMAAAEVGYEVEGVRHTAREVVRRLSSQFPFGDVARELVSLPRLTISARPQLVVLPLDRPERRFTIVAEVRNHGARVVGGRVALELPDGCRSEPAFHEIELAPRVSKRLEFSVVSSSALAGERRIRVLVMSQGRTYGESYDPIEHRDLETRYIVTPAEVRLSGIDVHLPENLLVGYVPGVGDEIPEAIEALGVTVDRLTGEDLAGKSLGVYTAIVLGTRAYAVRNDIVEHNRRLLDYVAAGGHLIVLYNTPELKPTGIAPYPGTLPDDAEEVSEEDSPVEILAADHHVTNRPNRITLADFDSWVEQRGSKFWSAWDEAYVPVIATHDEGQPPQRGGWLVARYGRGYYTYFAYALHRQLPYGVPGAFRILANLLALGRLDVSVDLPLQDR